MILISKLLDHILIALIICLTLTACSEKDTIKKKQDGAEIKSALIESNNNFSFNIFEEIVKNDAEEDNVFISPLSMYYALAMAGNGSNTDTYDAFSKLLGWDNQTRQEMLASMKELLGELLPENKDVVVEIANSLWARKDFPIKETYISESQNYFNAEARELNFLDPNSVNIINSWIEDKTHDKIKDVLTEISPDAVLFLINAIYFNGTWKYEFEDTSNINGLFTRQNGVISDVTYMRQSANFKYYEDDNFSAVKLPYVDSNYTMTVYLPNSNYSTLELAKDLNSEDWSKWSGLFKYKNINLTLPKFKFGYGNREIVPELTKLGLGVAFTPQSDFTNISDENIFISSVLHKSFIEVNEVGTEAAAVTVITFETTSVEPRNVNFVVNKPFIFTITEEKTQSMLFIGRVAFPEYND